MKIRKLNLLANIVKNLLAGTLAVLGCCSAAQAQNSTIVLRSGNGTIGGTDGAVTFLAAADPNSPFPNLFTASDFANASSGPAAFIVNSGPWLPALAGDTKSQWITSNASGGGTALYAINFTLSAVSPVTSLTLNYAVDNQLGGGVNGALYINGTLVPGIASPAGSFTQEYSISVPNIASLLKVGVNTLYIDAANTGSIAGLIFRAEIVTKDPGFATLYPFSEYPNDGGNPAAELVEDSAGNLYGTTFDGGTNGQGSAFELVPNGDGTYSENLLYSFNANPTDGASPQGALLEDSDGNFFGTTTTGGDDGAGAVFELVPNGDGTFSETILYSFGTNPNDGFDPQSALVEDSSGNLYGTTFYGGLYDEGTAFELMPNGDGTYSENVLYSFGTISNDGENPQAALLEDGSGNFFGTTANGGAFSQGTAFELVANGDGTYTENILYSFGVTPADGEYVQGGLLEDSSGNFYGTTSHGGDFGEGTAYELTPNGDGTYMETILYSFGTNLNDGEYPQGSLVEDSSGNLYGTTNIGGLYGFGTAFQLVPNGDGTDSENILHSFGAPDANDGEYPQAALLEDSSGNFFGTTIGGVYNSVPGGSTAGEGTVFRITPPGITANPTLTSPAPNSSVAAPVTVAFTLPGQALPGSVQLTFDDGSGTLRVLTLSSAEEGAGTNSFSFYPGDPTASAGVAGISGDTLIPLGIYTVTLSYQDAVGDPAATASAANVTVAASATPPPLLLSPAASSTVVSPITVTFALPGQAFPGSVKLTFDDGSGILRVLALSSAEEASGTNTFTFNPANPTSTPDITSITGDTVIPVGTYTVTLSYQDSNDDPAATASSANVAVVPLSTQYSFGIDSYSADLTGFVRSDYTSSASNAYIELGTDTTYANPVVPITHPDWSSNGYGLLSYGSVSDLTRDTVYHYQYVATINGTTYYGGDQTFTTTHDDPPTANPDTYYEPANLSQPVTLNVLANDTRGNPFDTLTIASFSQPAGGTLQITGSGTTLLYTPDSLYPGHDSFTYTISDGYGGTSTATVNIVNPFPVYAGTFQGLFYGNMPGYLDVTLGTEGSFTGSLRALGGSYSFAGALDDTGNAVVTVSNPKLPSLTLDLSLAIGNGGSFTFTVAGPSGSENGSFTPKVLYSKSNPAPEAGLYTIIIPPPAQTGTAQATASATVSGGQITSVSMTYDGYGYISAPSVTITSPTGKAAAARAVVSNGSVTAITVTKPGKHYASGGVTVTIAPPSGLPQGTGWGTMKVTDLGAVSIKGKLGDGTAFTAGSWIDEDYYYYYYYYGYGYGPQTFPVYANVYADPAGYIYGTMTFEDETNVSDFDGTLTWDAPAQAKAKLYINGFNTTVRMLGSSYVDPASNTLLDLPDAGGALLSLTGGGLESGLQNSITLGAAPGSAVTVGGGSADSLSMICKADKGIFTGKFTPPGSTKSNILSGVFFQKQNLGLGVFTGATESGNVNITPQ